MFYKLSGYENEGIRIIYKGRSGLQWCVQECADAMMSLSWKGAASLLGVPIITRILGSRAYFLGYTKTPSRILGNITHTRSLESC